jgi:hypothetical protein
VDVMVCQGCERRKAKLRKAWRTVEDRLDSLEAKVDSAEFIALGAFALVVLVALSVANERKAKAAGDATA